ncbi:hypothetical protein J542_2405 [Acinetobacter baumannii 299505]|nr:hypothetical protein J542_2405 [Acinetobacter baumannii 299505]
MLGGHILQQLEILTKRMKLKLCTMLYLDCAQFIEQKLCQT